MPVEIPDISNLNYDPETGIFTWIDHWFVRFIGKRAGRVNSNGYRQISIDDKMYYEHRLAFVFMLGRWPFEHTDHVNHIRDDNRWENLRDATRLENTFNLSHTTGKTGYKGVHLHKSGKYIAQIRIDGKIVTLGRFDNPQDAKLVYDTKSKEIHGEFYFNPD